MMGMLGTTFWMALSSPVLGVVPPARKRTYFRFFQIDIAKLGYLQALNFRILQVDLHLRGQPFQDPGD